MQLYAAPIPFANRASTASPLGPNNAGASAEEYALTAPDSPSLDSAANKEGFDLTSAEKYERGARAGYERDRATGGRGGAGAGGAGMAGLWRRRKWWFIGGGLLALAVIVGVAVGVPVAYVLAWILVF